MKTELFLRLRYLMCSLIITFVFSYLKSTQIIYLILEPCFDSKNYGPMLKENKVQQGWLQGNLDQGDSSFIYTNVAEAFYVTIKASICFSILVTLPLCCYQVWCFFMPSRYHREQTQAQILLVWGVLYITGCLSLICLWLVPQICQFLHQFSVQTGKLQIIEQLRIGPYLSWILYTEITLFIATCSPVFLYLTLRLQWFAPSFLTTNRRTTVYLLLFLAAFLSPPDFSSQLIITLCLFIFFESAIWFYFYKIVEERT